MNLLRTLILRPLVRDPLRTLLTILAVALGVAVVIAIELAGDAATGSFESSLETVAGKTDLEIYANGGVDEAWIGRLGELPFEAHYSPLMEARAMVTGAGSFPLYGVDALEGEMPGRSFAQPTQADAVVLSRAMAERLGLSAGSVLEATVQGHPHRFPILTTVDAGAAEFAALDIARFQQMTGRYGKLDRIEVTLAADERPRRGGQCRAARVAAGVFCCQTGRAQRGKPAHAARLPLESARAELHFAGGGRVPDLQHHRHERGAAARRKSACCARWARAAATVLWLFLAEALLLGVAGGAGAWRWGALLAGRDGAADRGNGERALHHQPAGAGGARPGARRCWDRCGIGAVVAFVSALGAGARSHAGGAHRGDEPRRARASRAPALAARSGVGGGLALAASPARARRRSMAGIPVGGYAAALLAIAAAALAAPAAGAGGERGWRRRLLGARAESLLAGRSLAASLARTSVIVAALATAIAMMASVGIMVGSFRETVALWLDVQLARRSYVRPAVPLGAGEYPPLAERHPRR